MTSVYKHAVRQKLFSVLKVLPVLQQLQASPSASDQCVPSAHFRGQLLPVGSYPFFEFLKDSWFMFVPQVCLHGTPNLLRRVKVRTFSWTLPPADPVHVKDR